ncbi:repair protein [Aspergillus sp. HF37]|nr:repair protein [Aspergillus sp. HF37]
MGSQLHANSAAMRRQIENHHFEDEHGEEYDASSFGGFGGYMRRKKIKLQNLDAEIRATSADCPPIFRGVIAHVNGYTQPSLQDLHRLIVSHGGGFLQYLDGKTTATHIIASSLTPKKREEFRRYRVVKPAWVMDSIKAGRLLPWDDFRVVDEGQSQKVLKFDNGRFLSRTNNQQPSYREQTNTSWYASQLKGSDIMDPPCESQKGFPVTSATVPTIDGAINESQSDYGDFPSFSNLDGAERGISPTPQKNGKFDCQPPAVEAAPDDTDECIPDRQTSVAEPQMPFVQEPPPETLEMTAEEHNAHLLSDPRMRNSSGVNPDFIQQYYRESRLHHLSTWKAELKAQLQSATNEKSQSQMGKRKPVPGARKYILHVDFDCFFAAISTLKHPEVFGKPVAVAHGSGTGSTGSEIASCNYLARARGVKNGMWMKGALQTCPELKVLPYDFPAYEDASRKFYSAVLAVDGVVQSVSIDEALVDITTRCLEAGGTDGRGISEGSIYREQAKADETAQTLRDLVKEETGCAVSVGIGGNILLAKVALRKAKPAGQFQLKPDAVLDFIGGLTVQDLPGVGYSLGAKMEELGIKLVKDIRDLPREKLLSSLGPKTGAKMWDYARGIDRAEVGNEVLRKSVSAEVNWGIRFANQSQAEHFVKSLCEELHRRLVENLVKGKQLTLKVLRRSADAPLEPVKHLGHGKCDVFNKSAILGVASNDTEDLGKEALSMLKGFDISPGDLRGIGIQMTKLEPLKSGSTTERPESSQRRLNFTASPVRRGREQTVDPDDLDSPRKGDSGSVNHGPTLNVSNEKPLNITGTQFVMPSQPDPAVVSELPGDIRSRLMAQVKSRARRSESPCPPARKRQATAEPPPQSQLDPETLAALPDDVRAEVLAYYNPPSNPAEPALPGPAASSSSSSRPSRATSATIPAKRRRGRLPSKPSGNMKLTQSSFGLSRPSAATPDDQTQTPPREQPGISEDFLAALPEDIRQEVLEEHRRSQTHQRPNPAPQARNQPPAHPQPQPQPEKRVRLPPLPERPTFTSKKLSNQSDLRDVLGAWHATFGSGGPFRDDVESLCGYLSRVVFEERDVDKAVSVVNWLAWLDGDRKSEGRDDVAESQSENLERSSQSIVSWDQALQILRDGVGDAVQERGLPPVEFD